MVSANPNSTTFVVYQEGGPLLTLAVGACGVGLGFFLSKSTSSGSTGPSESFQTGGHSEPALGETGGQDPSDPIEIPSSQEGEVGGGGPPLQVPTLYPDQHLYQLVHCTQASWANCSGKYHNAPGCPGLKSAKTPIMATTVMMARGQNLSCCLICCPGW